MRRRLALAPLLTAVLALDAHRAFAEPYDLDLAGLGAPSPTVWQALGETAAADTLARESKQRFAVLSSEVALALSSSLLHPASTIGHSQFDFDLEMGIAGVHPDPVGSQMPANASLLDGLTPWPTRSRKPHDLWMPSFHVRKALPFSFELGGRMTYVSMSSYYAVQGEAKWALNEGFEYVPDLAIRLAHTRLLGQKDWILGVTDVDFMISKRWGVMGVTSFTPYLALRFAFMSASTKRIQFDPLYETVADPAALAASSAAFPSLRAGFYRTTIGLRFTSYSASLAAELTYFGGKDYSGKDSPDEYPDFTLASSVAGAFKVGWEF